jgi:hypothetical protein
MISFLAASSATGTSSVTVAKPIASLGSEVLVALVVQRDTAPITAPVTWRLIQRETHSDSGLTISSYWNIAVAAEPTITWTKSTTNTAMVVLVAAFANVNPVLPLAVTGSVAEGASATLRAQGVTTSPNGTMLMGFFAAEGATTFSDLAPMSQAAQLVSSLGSGDEVSAVITYQFQPSSGSSGDRSVSIDGSQYWLAQLIALKR